MFKCFFTKFDHIKVWRIVSLTYLKTVCNSGMVLEMSTVHKIQLEKQIFR